jgi:hypothetical protein
MKKKPPAPTPAPAQKPPAPAKQAAPPQPAPAAPATEEKTAAPAPTAEPTGGAGKDLSQVPAEAPATPAPPAGEKSSVSMPPRLKLPGAPDPIDWFAMRQPFLTRGVPWTGREMDDVQVNWTFTYNNLLRWGIPMDLSIKIANIGTPIAYDFAMARDNPTQIEKFDMETERMLPVGKKLGKFVIPVITPETLSWSVEKITGKKLDFRF